MFILFYCNKALDMFILFYYNKTLDNFMLTGGIRTQNRKRRLRLLEFRSPFKGSIFNTNNYQEVKLFVMSTSKQSKQLNH